jgi:hypothetical protein
MRKTLKRAGKIHKKDFWPQVNTNKRGRKRQNLIRVHLRASVAHFPPPRAGIGWKRPIATLIL